MLCGVVVVSVWCARPLDEGWHLWAKGFAEGLELTHRTLLSVLSNSLPVNDELAKRTVKIHITMSL